MEQIKIALLLLLIAFAGKTYCQTHLSVAKCAKCRGVIISEKPEINLSDYQYPYTVSKSEVDYAESLLCKYLRLGKTEKLVLNVKKLKRQLAHSHRQYYSYVNVQKDTIVVLQTIDYTVKRFDIYFGEWEKKFLVGLGDIYYKNVHVFRVNLTNGRVSIW